MDKSHILELEKESSKGGRRLKRASGLTGQLRTFLTSHDVESGNQLENGAFRVTGRVLAVDIRHGVVSLICEQLSDLSGQASPLKESDSQDTLKREDQAEEAKAIKSEPVSACKERLPVVPSRKIFRVVLNQILSHVQVTVGEIITVHGAFLRVVVQPQPDLSE